MEAILKREIVSSRRLSRSILVCFFAAAMTLGAYVRIPLPFTPVPVTLQTFFVLLAAALLGGRMGTASQLLYFCAGISGLGVFTGSGAGLYYFQGITGGYLIGFLAAQFAVSSLSRTIRIERSVVRAAAVFLLADLLLLACGTLWLKVLCGYGGRQAMLYGFWPFVPGDALKAVIAAYVYIAAAPRIKKIVG